MIIAGTRSMLDSSQGYPRGSQSYPSPAAVANPDGSTTIYFGPTQPQGVPRGNCIETMPGKGWNTLLRFYSPLESFFEKRAALVSLSPRSGSCTMTSCTQEKCQRQVASDQAKSSRSGFQVSDFGAQTPSIIAVLHSLVTPSVSCWTKSPIYGGAPQC